MKQIKSNSIKSITLILCFFVSCTFNNRIESNKDVVEVLDSLSQSFNKDTLGIAVAKLDSILSYDENKKNGYYYYKRGYCHTVLGNYKKAINDLEISQKIRYKFDKSSELIEYNKGLLENQKKYAPYY